MRRALVTLLLLVFTSLTVWPTLAVATSEAEECSCDEEGGAAGCSGEETDCCPPLCTGCGCVTAAAPAILLTTSLERPPARQRAIMPLVAHVIPDAPLQGVFHPPRAPSL